jgi:hypothetical protein
VNQVFLPLQGRAGPARQAGNFLLLAQKKVTKEKSPTAFVHLVCTEGSVDHDHRRSTTEPFTQVIEPNAVRALSFGAFSLGQQKKVTRLPGGTGAASRRAAGSRRGGTATATTRSSP